ncbi:hypothetical protein RYX36_015223 [Vicia faba]
MIVTDVGTGITTLSPYSFVSFTNILGNIDMNYLIDVIGILSSVGREKVYERNRVATKFKVIELESNGIKLEYTLFGLYVNALDAFLQSGCNGNVVVVAQYLKVKLYNGKVQLQNAINSTKLLFNLEIHKAENLKVHNNIGSPTQPFNYMKYASKLSLEEEFLNLSQRKTIEELKDCQDGQSNMLLVAMIGGMLHVSATMVLLQTLKGFSALSAKSMFGQLCQDFRMMSQPFCQWLLVNWLNKLCSLR